MIGDIHSKWDSLKSSMVLPLIAAPMFLVSGPDLVLATCRQGVVGAFPFPNARTIDILEEWLDRLTRSLDPQRREGNQGPVAPYAANMVVHSSYDRLGDEIELVKRYRPGIVITALGSPKAVVDVVHEYGGLVFADVASVPYARKAAATGVDGLVLVSAGAGGHTGQMSPFAFVPAVREFFDGLIVVAGSICNGQAIRAAELIGADLAYMGTPFIAAEESMASREYRDMLLAAEFEDLVLSNALTGANAYYLKASLRKMGYDPDRLDAKSGPDFAGSQQKIKAWRDVWSAGHGVGTIKAVEPAAAIIDRLREEYQRAIDLPPFGGFSPANAKEKENAQSPLMA
ncbi:MAG: nitronate monooxygenase [Alphaproteobacteria bacterium]|nr:MAG: nitronate monooxygenase [Alphaproteobacteria bacterium]